MTGPATTALDLLPGRPVWVTMDTKVCHVCPVDGTADADHLEVTYDARPAVIEAHSFEAYLDTFDRMAITIEELVVMVAADLAAVGVAARVRAWGEHGEGLALEVRSYEPDRA